VSPTFGTKIAGLYWCGEAPRFLVHHVRRVLDMYKDELRAYDTSNTVIRFPPKLAP
jgi:hypothetical protein